MKQIYIVSRKRIFDDSEKVNILLAFEDLDKANMYIINSINQDIKIGGSLLSIDQEGTFVARLFMPAGTQWNEECIEEYHCSICGYID